MDVNERYAMIYLCGWAFFSAKWAHGKAVQFITFQINSSDSHPVKLRPAITRPFQFSKQELAAVIEANLALNEGVREMDACWAFLSGYSGGECEEWRDRQAVRSHGGCEL